MQEHKEETTQIMARWLNQTADVAKDSYESILPSFSTDGADGAASDKTFEFAIESRKATVRTEKPVPLSQVRDFTLLREVQRELRLR
jgi:ABC-type nitrate/sulfonate/bicarbonate transport system substrate-binding protein